MENAMNQSRPIKAAFCGCRLTANPASQQIPAISSEAPIGQTRSVQLPSSAAFDAARLRTR
jgi:hypothetical protein